MNRRVAVIVLLGLAVLICLVGVSLSGVLGVMFGTGRLNLPEDETLDQRILLGIAGQGEGLMDLALLELGQPVEEAASLVKGVQPPNCAIWGRNGGGFFPVGGSRWGMGGFLPGLDSVYACFQVEGQTILRSYVFGEETTETDLISVTPPSELQVYVFEGAESQLIVERRGDRLRCTVALFGEALENLGPSEACGISGDGTVIYYLQRNGEEATLHMADLEESRMTTRVFLDAEIESMAVSHDGSRTAYLKQSGEKYQLILAVSENQSILAESESWMEILRYGFAAGGEGLFYIVEDQEGGLHLFVMGPGESIELAAGESLNAAFSPAGDYLVYLVGDETGVESLHSYSTSTGATVEILHGDLEFSVVDEVNRIYILQREGEELTLYSAGINGRHLVALYHGRQTHLKETRYLAGESLVFFWFEDEHGLDTWIAATGTGGTAIPVAGPWDEARLLNVAPGGKAALVVGRWSAEDPMGLYEIPLAQGAAQIRLDGEVGQALNAVYTINGESVLYTATAEQPDTAQVRQAQTGLGESGEVLYSRATLVDVVWGAIDPFQLAGWHTPIYRKFSLCPNAPMLVMDEPLAGSLNAGEQLCFRLLVEEPGSLAIRVIAESNMDTRLILLDEQGEYVKGDDDGGDGLNPTLLMGVSDGAGTFYVIVEGVYGAGSGEFEIWVSRGNTR